MKILGIGNGHDSCVTLVESGRVVFSFELERVVRVKHAGGPLEGIIDDALAAARCSTSQVDVFAIVPSIWENKGADWQLRKGTLPCDLSRATKGRAAIRGVERPACFVPHHLAHASYAFHSSGFHTADVITMDGGGGFCDASISTWRRGRLVHVHPLHHFHLGALWSVLARELFGTIFDAGKVMGLAAYGSPDRTAGILRARFHHGTGLEQRVLSPWDEPGPLEVAGRYGWRSTRAQDMAAGLQDFTTSTILELARSLAATTKNTRLCLGGGVALNGYTNSALARSGVYEQCFFPNAPHDGGLSLGAALFVAGERGEWPADGRLTPFLGMASNGGFDEADTPVPYASMAHVITDGGVVGISSGRAELGPRALGHRSLVALGASPWIRDYVSTHLKRRECFRPLAPVFRRSDAARWLDDPDGCNDLMTQISRVSSQGAKDLAGLVHVDGTVRAQLVDPGHTLYPLLEEIERLGYPPVLINTSFNAPGEPLCNSTADAVLSATSIGLDALCIDGVMYEGILGKRRKRPRTPPRSSQSRRSDNGGRG